MPGASSENFTIVGGLGYHGSVADFVRNTAFDSWCFTCKWGAGMSNTAGMKCSPEQTG